MKLKLLFTFVFLTVLVKNSFSQNYIPMLNNSTWNIVSANFGGQQNFPTTQSVNVVINSFTYKKFIDPTTNTDVYLREDIANRRVYRRVNGNDQLLYDFSLQVTNNVILSDGKNYTVQSISNVNVLGGTRRKFNLINFVGGFALNSETWVEGVGSINNPFRPNFELPTDPYIYLTCSAQNGVNVYNQGIANGQPTPTDCSNLLSIEEVNYLKNEVNFYPNPFQKQLFITNKSTFENSTLKIFNSIGQIVTIVENINGKNIVIDRGNLKSGIYFTQITENEKTIITNKIIISD